MASWKLKLAYSALTANLGTPEEVLALRAGCLTRDSLLEVNRVERSGVNYLR